MMSNQSFLPTGLNTEAGQPLNAAPGQPKIDWPRYRRVRWFFARAFFGIIWWDIVLNRPILRWLRTPPLPRWRDLSRRYRVLAVEMGGVLIKLGQFLSIRVDILPPEVTSELAGLQDEVPPEPFEAIKAQLEADFGRPLADSFAWFSPQPMGAASLAQAHLARLKSGEEVVVKVLRPGINVLVETDLAAIRLALRWLKLYKRISQRVNLDWLGDEFTAITRKELDFVAEGHNAERLAADFADDAQVYIPKIYWDDSAGRTLTLENVAYIKIDDFKSLEAAGINRVEVAQKFFQIYMRQIFETNFVHADPHPGNVFVKPLPHPDEIKAGVKGFAPADSVPYHADRPFQIAFVDFGMVAVIPERLRVSLKDFIIGVGSRDAHAMVLAYADAGIILPGADLKRLEEATADMFKRLWGVRMGQVRDLAAGEMDYFVREYRDIVYEAPFQFPADLLFVMRSMGILSGMATTLDPNFDPWRAVIPFAERLAAAQLRKNWRDWLQDLVTLAQLTLKLPGHLDQMLTEAQRGNLVVQTALSTEARRSVQRLEQAVNRLAGLVAAAALLLAAVNLYTTGHELLAGAGLALAVMAFLWGIWRS